MASLKCSKCGYGIHYHDEPNGVEWVAFELGTWNNLCASSKSISSYEIDTKSGWYTVWKCEECGTLHVFKAMDINMDRSYELQDNAATKAQEENVIECIAFEDIIWDEITETESNGNDFDNRFKDYPRKYIRICEETLSVYTDEEYNLLENTYSLLDATEE